MLSVGHTVLPVGVLTQKTPFVACNTVYSSSFRAIDQVGNGHGWKSWGMEGKEAKEQIGNHCSDFQKLKETKLTLKLFNQTIEIV